MNRDGISMKVFPILLKDFPIFSEDFAVLFGFRALAFVGRRCFFSWLKERRIVLSHGKATATPRRINACIVLYINTLCYLFSLSWLSGFKKRKN